MATVKGVDAGSRSSGWQRLGPLVVIPRLLQTLGVDGAEVFPDVGVSLETFGCSSNLIPFTTLGALLQRCSEKTGCDHFGLLVGSRARSEHFGLVGELMRNAPTLGAAITDWASNHSRFVRGSVIHLVNHDDVCTMTYRVYQKNVSGIEQIIDTAVASGFAVLREISAQSPIEVLLSRKSPKRPQVYREVFGINPHFDASVGGLTFSYESLGQPILGADAEQRQHLESRVKEYQAIDLPTLADQVRRQLGARITADSESKAEIAVELGLPERAMSRRLLLEETSFRDLTNEIRFEVACQLLANTALTVAKIADALHYSDASAFVRAFQRSAGMSPLAWRAHARKAVLPQEIVKD